MQTRETKSALLRTAGLHATWDDVVHLSGRTHTKIVQWHGTDPSDRDHRSLAHYPEADALLLLRRLREASYAGVLTLEVFREADLERSLELAERWLVQVGGRWES